MCTQEESHVTTEAEIGRMCLQARESPQPPGARRDIRVPENNLEMHLKIRIPVALSVD